MKGPHWNPTSADIVIVLKGQGMVHIAIVLKGQGMVHVVCPGIANEKECKNTRIKVEEGDVLLVPRYYPMAQMSFNNESFIFMGFTMTLEDFPTQYVAGKTSILKALDKDMLAKSFDVSKTTLIDEVLSAKIKSIISECTLCAEDEERVTEEEREREWDGGRGGRKPAEMEGEIAGRGGRDEGGGGSGEGRWGRRLRWVGGPYLR